MEKAITGKQQKKETFRLYTKKDVDYIYFYYKEQQGEVTIVDGIGSHQLL